LGFLGTDEVKIFDKRRQLKILLDYQFGRVSQVLPNKGIKFLYSRKSGRIRQVFLGGELFATIKPNGAVALTIVGAKSLLRSRVFRENCVVVENDAVEFVRRGNSVFCKFVAYAGKRIHARSEVAVLDKSGALIAVGRAVLPGPWMTGFKAGVAVKVREGSSV
jgi:uncharacterized protein with predicted RNA binding PUA domain